MSEREAPGIRALGHLRTDIQLLCAQAIDIIKALVFPKEQHNVRSGLTLLALAGMRAGMSWADVTNPVLGITPIMTVMKRHYGKVYAPNTRETVRRQSVHQFRDAGMALVNPGDPDRPTNSDDTVYQLTPETLDLLRTYGTDAWQDSLATYLVTRDTLMERYGRERAMTRITIGVQGIHLDLTPGRQSVLIRRIIEDFCSFFLRDPHFIYVGDTGGRGGKTLHYDPEYLAALGVTLEAHGKFPDLIVHDQARNWLVLIEAVISHGLVDGKRHDELAHLFAGSAAPIVYVTAFRDRKAMARYTARIDWATEVWCADSPTHMIHFDGERFLGPHDEDKEE